MALDPGHVTLLVVVATPRRAPEPEPDRPPPAELDYAVDREEMLDRWAAAADLLDPALAALEREGLVRGMPGLGGETHRWVLRPFGRRFFDFLQRVDEAGPL
jgi:hypothetical protein